MTAQVNVQNEMSQNYQNNIKKKTSFRTEGFVGYCTTYFSGF